jgi:hypothetical protein
MAPVFSLTATVLHGGNLLGDYAPLIATRTEGV